MKCEICGFLNPEGFIYCGRCGSGLSSSSGSTVSSSRSPIEGERKLVTVIFADISGFTALTDAANTSAEAEQVVQIVNHCLSELSDVVYEYDGYIDKYIGDALMAIFGAPRTHEDDPERALRCALAMRERLEAFNNNPPFPLVEPLGIHMGINSGTVIAGLIGTDRKRAYTVMGDVVNVASRLEDVSERDEILISEDTYRLVNRLFDFNERDQVRVKGKRKPLKIYEVLGVKDQPGTQRGLVGLRSPMVGRDEEYKLLQTCLDRLWERQGSIITVVGEAGLGKSRMIAELRQSFRTTSQGWDESHWLEGRGLSYRQSLSYRLVVDILHGFLGVTENSPEEEIWSRLNKAGLDLFGHRKDRVVPFLAVMMGLKVADDMAAALPLSEPHIMQKRMFMAFGELVETLAVRGPLVLVFEDLHWADPDSVRLIEYLITLTPVLPLALICVTRPDRETDFWAVKQQAKLEFEDNYYETNLEPLSRDESCLLVDQLLQVEHLPHGIENLIFSRSEGNPLFVEEVLRSLIEDGAIRWEDNAWSVTRAVSEVDIPDTLQGVLTARIDRLDEPVKRVLQIASVVGRVFPRFIIAQLVEDKENLDRHLAQLVEAELIRERSGDSESEAEYIFKHVLTMEAAYQSLLHQQRKVYHHQVGDFMARLYWLRGEEYASLVADHYYRGEAWDRALRYLHRAAEAAINAFNIGEAKTYYWRALEVLPLVESYDPTIRMELHEGLGKVRARLGENKAALDDLETALALAQENDDTFAQLRALNLIGSLRIGYDNYQQAVAYFERSLEMARRHDVKPGIVDALNHLGSCYLDMGELGQAAICHQEALQISQEIENQARLTASQDGLARIALFQGELAASVDRYNEVMQVRRHLGDHLGLMGSFASTVIAHSLLGDYQTAAQVCEEALALHDKVSNFNLIPFIHYNLAYGQLLQGDFQAAGENLSLGLHLAQKLEHKIWQALGHTQTAYYYLLLGRLDEGLTEAQAAVDLAGKTGSPWRLAQARFMLGVAHRYRGALAESRSTLEEVWADVRRLGFGPDEATILNELIQVYMEDQHWEPVPKLLERLLALADSSEMRELRALGRWLAARYALYKNDLGSASLFLVEARDMARKTGGRLSEILIETELARVFQAQGDQPNARKSRQNARQLLARIEEGIANDLLRDSFRESALARRASRTWEAV